MSLDENDTLSPGRALPSRLDISTRSRLGLLAGRSRSRNGASAREIYPPHPAREDEVVRLKAR